MHAFAVRLTFNHFLGLRIFHDGSLVRTREPNVHFLSVYDVQQLWNILRLRDFVESCERPGHALARWDGGIRDARAHDPVPFVVPGSCDRQSGGGIYARHQDRFGIEVFISQRCLPLTARTRARQKMRNQPNDVYCQQNGIVEG